MGFISNIFRRKNAEIDEKPPIYGGDGLSDSSPAIINCASMGVAQTLINRFIDEHCNDGYKREDIEYTIGHPIDPKKLIKVICVKEYDGGYIKFYFDLSRPVAVAKKMMGF